MYTCRKSLQIVSIFGKRALRPFPLRCGFTNISEGRNGGPRLKRDGTSSTKLCRSLRECSQSHTPGESGTTLRADFPAVDSQRHKRRAGPLQSGERSCNHVRLTEGDRPEGIRRR